MADSSQKPKFTAAEIKQHIQNIQKILDKTKSSSNSEIFMALTPEQIEEKLKRVNSPMIIGSGWNNTVQGGTVNYSVTIFNPDPAQSLWLYFHVFVGSGNPDPVPGTFLLNVDTRFPRLTLPRNGLILASNASAVLNFALKVPLTVEKTNYLGNGCLMKVTFNDTGLYLDRSVFPFEVA